MRGHARADCILEVTGKEKKDALRRTHYPVPLWALKRMH